MTPETYKALSKLAGETVSDINHRGSFAMIGFSGDDKPSFVKQVSDLYYFDLLMCFYDSIMITDVNVKR